MPHRKDSAPESSARLGFQGGKLAAKAGPVERFAGLARQSMVEAPKHLCEEKVTLGYFICSWAVHARRVHLMAQLVQFSFGGNRALARR
jgi:hypothetical protein